MEFTQGDLADALDVTVSFYSAIEMGKRSPSAPLVNQLVSLLDLNTAEESAFHEAAANSIEQIRINSSNAKPNARSVALSLARRFDSLEDDKIKKLQDILNE